MTRRATNCERHEHQPIVGVMNITNTLMWWSSQTDAWERHHLLLVVCISSRKRYWQDGGTCTNSRGRNYKTSKKGKSPVQTGGRRLYKKIKKTKRQQPNPVETLNATDQQGSEAGWSWGCWWHAESRHGIGYRSGWCQSRRRRPQNNSSDTCTPGSLNHALDTSAQEDIYI